MSNQPQTVYEFVASVADRSSHLMGTDLADALQAIAANAEEARRAMESDPIEGPSSSIDGPLASYWRGQDWACRRIAVIWERHSAYREEWKP